jgi:hypothetical protein
MRSIEIMQSNDCEKKCWKYPLANKNKNCKGEWEVEEQKELNLYFPFISFHSPKWKKSYITFKKIKFVRDYMK